MSDISNKNPLDIAAQAERDLNSHEAKVGSGAGASTSVTESGVDENVTAKFADAGASVAYGSEASGAGDNRTIPVQEGGGINKDTGRETKARDFEGVGGPEDKRAIAETERPGDQDVEGNVRQGGETRRP